jgi:excisionase family DNA binding protein
MNNDILLSPIRIAELENIIEKSVKKAIKEAQVCNQSEFTENSGSFLNVKQAAEFLNLAVPTVYSMVSRGELPKTKRSKRLYFCKEELVEYIKAGRRKTSTEEKADAGDFIIIKGRRPS